MNSYKLSEITEISTGYTFRSAIKPSIHGNFGVIQAKDVTNDLEITRDNLIKTNLDNVSLNAIVKNNDVILTSRGRFKAAVVNSHEPMIASSSVFIIRVKIQEIDPRYLAIYLNSFQGQVQISKLISGSYIKSIPKFNLSNLNIPAPSVLEQKNIIKLFQNINHQQKLLKRKIEIISNISQNSLIKILN